MGFKETIKKVFSVHTETTEKHYDEQFKTRYYKTTKDRGVKEITEMFQQLDGYKVKKADSERGEIYVQMLKPRKAFVTVTVIQVKPFKTAVDFSVGTETVFFTDFGYSRKVIRTLYKELDQKLQYIGSGLGEQLL
ncbi:DUF1499 domain-containing protein [Alkalihalobacillus sp. LMS39]|uniref:DUF1499 domain-containing protein n=1 Tax=Alkalihalobacillus sp. LMS39 TaxID=2924032 RepID=UPI001FB28FFD|nr:DUF1499 domain-containing protein [Alkalihalobacillus sp. LMS39]UOE93406.1 DUF1499 domain-containing protein [Alkalihalobacillus sp. LMS39]